MAERKPLVLVGGKPRQLPDGDVLMGMQLVLPVGLASGGVERVYLDSKARLPLALASGIVFFAPTGV